MREDARRYGEIEGDRGRYRKRIDPDQGWPCREVHTHFNRLAPGAWGIQNGNGKGLALARASGNCSKGRRSRAKHSLRTKRDGIPFS